MRVNAEALLVGKVSKNTVNNYSASWQLYLDFCGSIEAALDPKKFVEWREHMIHVQENAVSTINGRLAGVKRVIKELVNQNKVKYEVYAYFDRVDSLPSNALPERNRAHTRTRITPEQMRKMIDATNVDLNNPILARDRAILLTLATSGMRASEVASVKVEDVIDAGNGCVIDNIRVKGGRTRRVPISRECYEAIKDWLFLRPVQSHWAFTVERIHNPFVPEDDTYILWEDRPMSRSGILRTVKKYAKIAGIEHVKPHDFRRFVGTTLAKQDVRMAQKVLGHKSISTTATYYLLDEVELGVTENLF